MREIFLAVDRWFEVANRWLGAAFNVAIKLAAVALVLAIVWDKLPKGPARITDPQTLMARLYANEGGCREDRQSTHCIQAALLRDCINGSPLACPPGEEVVFPGSLDVPRLLGIGVLVVVGLIAFLIALIW
jgi:hypothetical protein